MPEPRFALSTRLFQDALLDREHLVHIAAHGFDGLELVATRTHFDYRSDASVGRLREWLSETGLDLDAVHAPVFEAVRGRSGIGQYSLASSDEPRRQAAVAEALAALRLALHIPFRQLIVHLGIPAAEDRDGVDNRRDAARRSAEAVTEAASRLGVQVAFELLPNALSTAHALVRLLEEELEGTSAGICLDYGHAHLTGDLADVIETVGGHIVATHIHDNDGRRDSHLMPFAGTIDWAAAMTETQKVGYDGSFTFEVAESGDPAQILSRAARVRARLADALVTF